LITPSRWAALWQGFGRPPPVRVFEALAQRYAETHRHYHTAQHIAECLAHFDSARHLCEHAAEVEMALWFHDAIYELRAKDNEEKSALWAQREMSEAGIAREACERVGALILATRHDALPDTTDARVLVDIDLSILGADSARFDQYEDQVGAEYSWVPAILFRRTRRTILEGFLQRASIYSTAHFHNLLEKKARDNLARSLFNLSRLSSG
jgi:predicted metal-dependent HD superfamily phosphohydrolase